LQLLLLLIVLLLLLLPRRGLEALVDEGLVASLGLSNCSLAQVEEVLAAAKHKPVCNQVRAFVVTLLYNRFCCVVSVDFSGLLMRAILQQHSTSLAVGGCSLSCRGVGCMQLWLT
jgi:hypothetical protein